MQSAGSVNSNPSNLVYANDALKTIAILSGITAVVATVALVILIAAPVLPALVVGSVTLLGLTIKSAAIIAVFSAAIALVTTVALNRLNLKPKGSCDGDKGCKDKGCQDKGKSPASSAASSPAASRTSSVATSPAGTPPRQPSSDNLSNVIPQDLSSLMAAATLVPSVNVVDDQDKSLKTPTPPQSPGRVDTPMPVLKDKEPAASSPSQPEKVATPPESPRGSVAPPPSKVDQDASSLDDAVSGMERSHSSDSVASNSSNGSSNSAPTLVEINENDLTGFEEIVDALDPSIQPVSTDNSPEATLADTNSLSAAAGSAVKQD